MGHHIHEKTALEDGQGMHKGFGEVLGLDSNKQQKHDHGLGLNEA